MKFLFLIFSILCSINTIVLVFRKSFHYGLIIMVILSIFSFILFSKWEFFVNISKNGIYLLAKMCIIVFVCLYTACAVFILLNANSNPSYNEDAIIVLGSGVNEDNTPTDTAKLRLNEAIAYYTKNPNCYIVVTGSYAQNSEITEAMAMKNYLIEHNIPSDVILTEDNAKSTYQNFTNSKIILEDNNIDSGNIVFVSQNFHLYRASYFAKEAGFSSINTIGVRTDIFVFIPAMLREITAVILQVFLKILNF